MIPQSSPRKLFSVLEVVLKLTIKSRQQAPDNHFWSFKKHIQCLFLALSLGSCLADPSQFKFVYILPKEKAS